MTVNRVRRRLSNRRLFSTSIVALLAALLTLLAFVGEAHAGPGKPIAGRDYVQQGPGDGNFIRIWIKQSARIYAPGLAEVFRTTAKKIRELNPQMTLAICFDPKTQKTHKGPSVSSDVESRESNEIWKGCAEANQWVYVYSGAFLMIEDPTSKIMQEKLDAEDELTPKAEPPPKEVQAKPAPPKKAPAPPAVAPTPPAATTQRPSDEIELLKSQLAANRELLAQGAARMGTLEGEKNDLNALLQEKDGKIATLRASVVPTVVRYLFGAGVLVLIVGLLFVGFKLNGSRGENANLRAVAESAQAEVDYAKIAKASTGGEVARAQEELRMANQAKTQAETAKNASDRARTQLVADVAQARLIGTEREARIMELEATSQQQVDEVTARLTTEHTDTKSAYVTLLTRLFEVIGNPQEIHTDSDLYELSRMALEVIYGHYYKFSTNMQIVYGLLTAEQGERVGADPNDLLNLQLLCQAFDRIRKDNAGLRDESIFTAEVVRLEGENSAYLDEIATVSGENSGLKEEVGQLKSKLSALQSAEVVRLTAVEERSQVVSELPPPPDPGKDIRAIVAEEEAARAASDSPMDQAVAAAAEAADAMAGEELAPETSIVVAPQSDLPAERESGRHVRVATLRQGMGHLADLLLPGSQERKEFFDAAEAVNEAAVHAGGLKVTELREISILRGLSQMWFEVFVPRTGVKAVQIQEFADDANALTFQPVAT